MSLTNEQLSTLENIQADFDTALSQRNWSDCRAMLSNLRDTGFDHEAQILTKSLWKAQQNPTEAEDEAAGHESQADWADRNYPRE